MSEEYKKDLRDQMQKFIKEKETTFAQREKELLQQSQQQQILFARKLEEEKRNIQTATEQSLRKTIGDDFEHKLRLLHDAQRDSEEKLKASRQRELEFLKKEQELQNKEAELELSVQRLLQVERVKLSKEIRDLEEQKVASRETEYQLRMKELEKQLDDQKKLAEEMKRKEIGRAHV